MLRVMYKIHTYLLFNLLCDGLGLDEALFVLILVMVIVLDLVYDGKERWLMIRLRLVDVVVIVRLSIMGQIAPFDDRW